MVPEAPLEQTEAGLVAAGKGWFVLNARDARWRHREGLGERLGFEGKTDFPQVGINLFVLPPGEPIGMYHWEADQEDFLVLSGEALLLIEGEERPLRQWDFVHCPAETKHMIVGAGNAPCAVLAVGAREHQTPTGWGGYTVDEAALRHSAGVEQETTEADEAYARFPEPEPTPYRDGWLPSVSSGVPEPTPGRRVVNARATPFQPYDLEGPVQPEMSWLPISYDRETGQGCYLMRMEPGAVTIAHDHQGMEEFLVLEGDLVDSDGTVFRSGDFVSYERGTHHNSWTEGGCLLAVFEWHGP